MDTITRKGSREDHSQLLLAFAILLHIPSACAWMPVVVEALVHLQPLCKTRTVVRSYIPMCFPIMRGNMCGS